MKAKLKHLHSPDLQNLKHMVPVDPENFGILVQAMIGPEKATGEESFDIMVCTPSWLTERVTRDGHLWGRHHLFVPRYDFPSIEKLVMDLCVSAEGPGWDSVANILARYGEWEFEDYQG